MNTLQKLRGTGRTYNLFCKALKDARHNPNKTVCVIIERLSACYALDMLEHLISKSNVVYAKKTFSTNAVTYNLRSKIDPGLCTGTIRIVYEDTLDSDREILTGLISGYDHRRTIVAIDHNVIEKRFNFLINEFHRYDNPQSVLEPCEFAIKENCK